MRLDHRYFDKNYPVQATTRYQPFVTNRDSVLTIKKQLTQSSQLQALEAITTYNLNIRLKDSLKPLDPFPTFLRIILDPALNFKKQ